MSLRTTAFSSRFLALFCTILAFSCASENKEFPLSPDKADLSGCSDEELDTTMTRLCASGGFRDNPLLVPLSRDFNMCLSSFGQKSHANGYGVDLNTAYWLSFLAANEYAHYGHFAPVLEEMGFGDQGEGRSWLNNVVSYLQVRDLEESGEVEGGSAASLEQHLVQDVIPGKKIQFFAAGRIEDDEFVDESTQMLWAQHRSLPLVLISFRGTEANKFEDILADLILEKEPLAGYGEVHGGFHGAYQDVVGILKKKLKAEAGQGLHIYITGHSLGGALASLASTTIMDYLEDEACGDFDGLDLFSSCQPWIDLPYEPGPDDYKLEGIYTFGMPRVGGPSFTASVAAGYAKHSTTLMRFRHGDDMVTQLPWQWMGYRHTGPLMHFKADGSFDRSADEQDPGDTEEYEGALGDHSILFYHARAAELSLNHELSNECVTRSDHEPPLF